MVAAAPAGMMVARLAWFWMLASGFVLPVGLPPGPEDPVVANVAPQECLFYLGWASMAKPDPKSPNQLEQLFAEPEVQQLVGEVERRVRDGLHQWYLIGGFMEHYDAIWHIKKVISSPGAMYLANLEMHGSRQPPGIQAGAILGLGDDAAKVRKTLEEYGQMVGGLVETMKVGEESFYRVKPGPEAPLITWGVYGRHVVVGIGEGEAEAIVKRMEGRPPEWLVGMRKRLVVDRPATVSYVNVRKIVQMIQAGVGPEAEPVIKGLGLDNFISYASVAGLDKEGYVSKSLLATVKQGGDLLAFLGGKPLEAKDLTPIPRDATLAAAARIEPDRLWETIFSMLAKADPRGAERFAEGLSQAEQQLGFKLREALLKPLGGVWCIYNSPGEGGLVVTGLTVVGQLNDAKRVKATHDRLLAELKKSIEALQRAMQGREVQSPIRQFKCAGQDVYMLEFPFGPAAAMRRGPGPDFPFAPSWCLTDKELIVALFPQNVKAYLLRGEGYQSLATAPEVAEVLKSEPGPVALSYVDTPELFRLVYPMVQIGAKFMTAQMQRQGVDVPMAVLPSAPAVGKHLRPGVTAVRRTQDGLETTSRQSMPGQNIGASAPVMAALLLPAVQAAREAARRSQCANNLKQIGLALLNYENAHKSFPPAYSVDKNGKPLLSWRVLILPYLEQNPLYQQFHLDEPWDSEHNKKLIDVTVMCYRCPSGLPLPGKTTYLTVRGKDTIFPAGEKGIDIAAIRDGTSNTILVVEAGDQSAVEWTKPDDFTPDEKNPTKGLLGHHPGGFNVVMADCSVHFLSAGIDPNVLRALSTRNGGEVIRYEDLSASPRRRPAPSKGNAVAVPKAKSAIIEIPKAEPPKPEPFKEEPPKAEPLKLDVPKAEANKAAPPSAAGLPRGPFSRARMQARRIQSMNNLKQIALALFNYENDRRTFPPAYRADKQGKPLLSWRVAILPHLEQEALYRQFRQEEPWDSEHNKKLIPLMPNVFRSPSSNAEPGKTNYLTVRGERTVFPGPQGIGLADIRDGTAATIITVEVNDERAVIWTKPDDFEPDPKDPLKGLLGLYPDGFLAGLADGSVLLVSSKAEAETLLWAFDRADRHVVDFEKLTGARPATPPGQTRPVKKPPVSVRKG